MPVSPQEARRRAKEQGPVKPSVKTYVFTDAHGPDLRPNAHGLGGVKPFQKAGKWCIALTDEQAKYWLDAGAIVPEQPPASVEQSK